MKRLFALCAGALAFAAADAPSQWGLRGCPPVGGFAQAQVPVRFVPSREWREVANDPGRIYLFVNGNVTGGWCPKLRQYRDWDATRKDWSEVKTAPADLPAKYQKSCGCYDACPCGDPCPCKGTLKNCGDGCSCVVAQTPTIENHGMDWSPTGRECYSINGRECPREEVVGALGDKKLTDDSPLLRLTVIGPKEARQKVLGDLDTHPALAPMKGKVLVQAYEPTDWAVARYGFKTTGAPTVYVQAPNGKVLHRQDDYADGPEALAGAIRKADPSYDPSRDPDRRKPDPVPAPILPNILPNGIETKHFLYAAIAVILFLWFRKK